MNRVEIGLLPPPCAPPLMKLLQQVEPATIGHFHDRGFLNGKVKAMVKVLRSVGTAVTVRCEGSDGSILHHALGQLRGGDFLFVDRAGDDAIACFGGASALAAQLRGVAGVVVDGCITDIDELRSVGLPVWARGLSARTTRADGRSGSFCAPIDCAGVSIHPGDAVLADENGVLVMSPAEAWELASRALEMQHAEQQTLTRLKQGESYPQILGTQLAVDEINA